MTENDKILIKYLVDAGVRCLKVEDKNGDELESLYLSEDYNCFYKTSKKSVEKNEIYLYILVNLLKN